MEKSIAKTGLWFGTIGAIIVSILMVLNIERSSSSTAAIGFIFIPFYFAIFFGIFFLLGSCVQYVRNYFANPENKLQHGVVLAFLAGLFIAGFFSFQLVQGLILTSLVSGIENAYADVELQSILNNSYFRNNKFVLGAIAQNSAASAQTLDRIARLPDPELQHKMESLFPLLGENGKGLAVDRLVLRNQNVSAETVEYLANIKNTDAYTSMLLGDVAMNSKASAETLRKLENMHNYDIDWGLSRNPSTPPDVFEKLLERERDIRDALREYTLENLLQNPSTTSEMRQRASELLKSY
ncbi:MAG: hypothetical protein ACD_5C00041G0003 [uncultured bacterium]|nr:MAG: hypothetical protein ACD_5C00041G0003 [uncultured bacterium]